MPGTVLAVKLILAKIPGFETVQPDCVLPATPVMVPAVLFIVPERNNVEQPLLSRFPSVTLFAWSSVASKVSLNATPIIGSSGTTYTATVNVWLVLTFWLGGEILTVVCAWACDGFTSEKHDTTIRRSNPIAMFLFIGAPFNKDSAKYCNAYS